MKKEMKFWSAKRIFAFSKFDTKSVCVTGLLIALCAVLSVISGYLRIGAISKLSLSFAAVFLAARLYGASVGAICAAAADIISFAVNPVAAFMPQLTLIEFVYGFIYGFLFYKTKEKMYFLNTLVCVAVLFATNLFLKSFVMSVSFFMPYKALVISRLPLCAVQSVIIFTFIILIRPFLGQIEKMCLKK